MGGNKSEDKGLGYMFAGTLPQVLVVLSCTVSTIADGMSFGWSAPMLPYFDTPGAPFQLTDSQKGWLENIYLLGGICGIPCTLYIVDRIGRKHSILMAGMVNLIAWILIAIAKGPNSLLVARFMIGLAGDVAFVATPMYIAEIADQKIRGFLSSLIYTMLLVGILLIYIIGPYVSIFSSACVACTFLILQLVTFTFMPESPYYHLTKGRYQEARRSLKRLRTRVDIEEELTEISDGIKRQNTKRGRPLDIFTGKTNRRAAFIMIILNASQHLSGYTAMMMNMHVILATADSIYIETNYAAMIFCTLMMAAALTAGLFCDRFGRKILLTISSVSSGLVLFILAVFLHVKHLGYDVRAMSWIPIFCVFSYALVFKIGLGVIPIVLTAELFSANVKAVGMCMADGFYIGWAILSVHIFFYFNSYAMFLPFYIYATCALLTALYCVFFVPETKGKTLDEIQMILRGVPVSKEGQGQSSTDKV